jgi:heparanase 1
MRVNMAFTAAVCASHWAISFDQNTFAPRPNYWAALLWRKLMGTTVLDPGPSHEGFHIYAHHLRDHPGGVAILVINNSRTKKESVELATAAERYTLTARKLGETEIQLDDRTLSLGPKDELPNLDGEHIAAGRVEFAPATITFLAITRCQTGVAACS